MKKVVDVCKEYKIEILTLEVNENNKYAIKMYQDLGFIVGSIRKRYYDNKEDALLMMLELGGKT